MNKTNIRRYSKQPQQAALLMQRSPPYARTGTIVINMLNIIIPLKPHAHMLQRGQKAERLASFLKRTFHPCWHCWLAFTTIPLVACMHVCGIWFWMFAFWVWIHTHSHTDTRALCWAVHDCKPRVCISCWMNQAHRVSLGSNTLASARHYFKPAGNLFFVYRHRRPPYPHINLVVRCDIKVPN